MWNTVCICVSVYDGYQTQCSAHVKQTFLHWVTSKGQKCRNSMTSPHHGLPIQGRLMLASYSATFPGHSLHTFNYWGPEVYIALLQTSGIQKCCLAQWASKALTAARWKMFQYKLHESRVLPKCSGYCYGLGRLIYLDVNFCSASICQRKGT